MALHPAPSAVLGLLGAARKGRVHGPRRLWRGAEPLQHAFPSYEDRWHCSRSLPRGSARRAKWWEAWQGQQVPRNLAQSQVSSRGGGREGEACALCGLPVLLVFCFRPAYQQSLPRRQLLQCSHYLERQPDFRFRRTFFGEASRLFGAPRLDPLASLPLSPCSTRAPTWYAPW